MKETESIEINLEFLGKTEPLQEHELIYRNQIREMRDKIIAQSKVNVNEMSKGDKTAIMHHPCFFINGGRGSGKSTVLRALRKSLDNHDKDDNHKIKLLADLDPTELADTENFFVHILGRVQKQLQKRKKDFLDGEKQNILKQAYNCIKVMSRGLSLLTRRNENTERCEDADYYIQESVLECVSSTQLKEKFAELMDCLSSLCEISVWLVTVDDADMNFNKCSEVFETIRKYLLNPRMVFVFAGDLKLYTMVVRGMQMGHFGKTSLKYDELRKQHIFDLMDNLEEQYIMKLFPAANRINLSYFGDIIEMNPLIKYGDEVKAIRMKKYLIEELKQCHVDYDKSQVFEFISGLSTRSALQLLAHWMKHIKRDGTDDSERAKRQRNMRYWCNGIQSISSHALIKHRIFSDALQGRGRKGIIKSLFIFGKKMEIGSRGARLFSGNSEESLQKVAFYLSAEVVRQMQSVSDIIFYMFNLFPYLQRYGKDVALSEKHVNHLNGSGARQFGEDCSNVVLALKEKKDYFFNGVIPLDNSEHMSRNENIIRISASECFHELISVVRNDKSEKNITRFIALYHSLCLCKVEEKYQFCLSIYNFLFVIQALIDLNGDDENLRDKIQSILLEKEIGLGVRYGESENTRKMSLIVEKNKTNKLLIDFLDELEQDKQFVALIDKIEDWKKKISKTQIDTYLCTAESLYKCWDDFWDQCNYITETAKIKSYHEKDLVDAWTLFDAYLDAFRKSAKKYLGVDDSSLLNSCPLWKDLKEEDWLTTDLCQKLRKVNIAPVDIWLDIEKMKKFVVFRLNMIKTEVEGKMYKVLENIVQKATDRFDSWCTKQIYEAERYVMEKREMWMNKISLKSGSKEQKLVVIESPIRELERLKSAIRERKTSLVESYNKLRERYHIAVPVIYKEQARSIKQRLFDELQKINSEEIAHRRIVQLINELGQSRSPYRKAIESPMENEIYEEEKKAQQEIGALLKDFMVQLYSEAVQQNER